MKEDIIITLKYWYKATLHPRKAIEELKTHPRKLVIGFWINFVFGFS